MSLFDDLSKLPLDPIFGVNAAYTDDPRKEKINLSIGAYRTEELKTYTLPSILEAKKRLMEETSNKEYLPIDGSSSFRKEIGKLALGKHAKEFYVAGSLGGTGALNLIGQLLKKVSVQSLYIPDLSWPNHRGIFSELDLDVKTYPYLKTLSEIDLEAITLAIEKADEKSAFVFHACCHNPSGCDPEKKEWEKIAKALKNKEHFVILDMAYHGFGQGLEEDRYALHAFMEQGLDIAVCYSCSKNFGLYGERTGALCVRTHHEKALASHVKKLARTTYSNPARFGQELVSIVLEDKALKAQWEKELTNMKERIIHMREQLYKKILDYSSEKSAAAQKWPDIRKQKGFFGFMGITAKEVLELQQKHGIYMPNSGRINMAGLSEANIDQVAKALVEVCCG